MGLFSDIAAGIDSGKTELTDMQSILGMMGQSRNTTNKSVAERARRAIMLFPILASTSLSYENIHEVANCLEMLYANYVRLVITNECELIDLKHRDTKKKFLERIHQNDTANYGLPSSNDFFDRVVEFGDDLPILNESFFRLTYKELTTPAYKNFNLNSIDNLGILSEAGRTHAPRPSNKSKAGETSQFVSEYISNTIRPELYGSSGLRELNDSTLQNTIFEYSLVLGSEMKKIDPSMDRIDLNDPRCLNVAIEALGRMGYYPDKLSKLDLRSGIQGDKATLENVTKTVLRNLESNPSLFNNLLNFDAEYDYENLKNLKVGIDNKLLDTQIKALQLRQLSNTQTKVGMAQFEQAIKKNNDLEPVFMSLPITYDNGVSMTETVIRVGVKTIVHSIKWDEMVKYLVDSLTKNRFSFRIIRYLTGEIKLVKDLIFDVDNSKKDALSKDKSVKWWRHLKARKWMSKARAFLGKTGFTPNATIVLSMTDVNKMKYDHKIDLLEETRYPFKLCNIFFLMHIAVVDDIEKTIKIFNCDTKDWEEYSFDRLSKEMKAVIKNNSPIMIK